MPEYQFHQFLTGPSCRQAHWRREDPTAKLQPTVALGCSSVGLTEISWFPRKLDRSWKRQISHPLETEEKAALKAVPFVQVLDDVGLNFWKKKQKKTTGISLVMPCHGATLGSPCCPSAITLASPGIYFHPESHCGSDLSLMCSLTVVPAVHPVTRPAVTNGRWLLKRKIQVSVLLPLLAKTVAQRSSPWPVNWMLLGCKWACVYLHTFSKTYGPLEYARGHRSFVTVYAMDHQFRYALFTVKCASSRIIES